MPKQLIFKDKYVKKLKDELNVDFYKGNEFIYDKKQILMLPNINHKEGLSERLDASDDCKSAIQIYEAFKELEPIQASDERLWTYLSHVDLYPYMIKRWNDVQKGTAKDNQKFILDHWFLSSSAQSSLMRHAIAGLWWSVYLSIDYSRKENKYDLTKILFRQLDFPTRTLGVYKLGRHKEAVIGILEFIEDNEGLFKTKFEHKTRFVTKHLNVIGGVKPISYYDRSFFKSELQKVSDRISMI
ncbi:DUF6339 family protein [Sphingobacterium pedocola]|uniref:DUF4274 domain-containing protein n=1 Tax=Sphingobacterium pedocola TaxID=2082722 RepID=A0ABR9T7X6_9SPHI|nr:DUF6339 family protein [Sphingobacterium pedocola]MBE8721189.1 hypothetical protein [Sphingobacterium pedocola]